MTGLLPPRPSAQVPPTGASSMVGALAAAQVGLAVAARLEDAASNDAPSGQAGKEVFVDFRHHRHYETQLLRRSDCRFDHETFAIQCVENLGLVDALALLAADENEAVLSVEGDCFVSALQCLGCGQRRSHWALRRSLTLADRACPGCGGVRVSAGFDLVERVRVAQLPSELRGAVFERLGVQLHDVVSLRSGSRALHFELGPPRVAAARAASLVVLGIGVIGSHLIEHLARIEGIGQVLLVDPDVYDAGNLRCQSIHPADVGRAKVEVQAARLRSLAPGIEVTAVVDVLESLPLGVFRDALVISCLDSRLARVHANRAAWRTGSIFIDSAVSGADIQTRVAIYDPSGDGPCIECGFEDADYAGLEQSFPCDDESFRVSGPQGRRETC